MIFNIVSHPFGFVSLLFLVGRQFLATRIADSIGSSYSGFGKCSIDERNAIC
jgi:hypothetical protein